MVPGRTTAQRTVTVGELPIDPPTSAAAVTDLRYGSRVPLTYPFALTFHR